MKDYQLRVIEEKKELDEKITKLKNFITSNDKFFSKNLVEYDRRLLLEQIYYMYGYSAVLSKRISTFV